MNNFFKYLGLLFLFILFVIFYLILTPSGNKYVYNFLSERLTDKTGIFVEIKSINLYNYPQVTTEVVVKRKAKVTLTGLLDDHSMNMNYTVTTDCIKLDHCEIDGNLHLKGRVHGEFDKLNIYGEGDALEGDVKYSFIKHTNKVEDFKLKMHNVNSDKLFQLLGQETIIHGRANANVDFSIMDETHKQGSIIYNVETKDFKGIPLKVHTKIDIDNMKHKFSIEASSKSFELELTKGTYDQEKKIADAFYVLDIKDLAPLKDILGHEYHGPFYAMGEINYNEYIRIHGLSKSLGGLIDYMFEKDGLLVKLQNVSFHEIMNLFDTKSYIDGATTGAMYYSFNTEKLAINTKLTDAKFMHTGLIDKVYRTTGVNMLLERFESSSLIATYIDQILEGDLKLSNNNSHFLLTDAKLNFKRNEIAANFDFKMQKQELSGSLYGELNDPSIDINLQRLIKYQMGKQLDSFIGKENRKTMESMPLSGIAQEAAVGAASFMGTFFK